ncbi:MAG TPA: hypothetical protein VHC95_06290 [Opitutales bacterium]|nr:hypothetical protein [Opitutales bacterium]
MSNPLWLGSGGCPTFQVKAAIKSGAAALGGINEFGTQSTPPVYYRKFATSGSGWTWDKYDPLAGHAHVSQVSFSSIGLSAWAFDPAAGWPPSVTTESDCTVTTVIYAPYFGAGSITSNPLVENDLTGFLETFSPTHPSGAGVGATVYDHFTGQPFWEMSFAILSKTQAEFTMAEAPGGNDTITSGAIVYTLSDPDTEADAYSRFVAGASAFSVGPIGPNVSDVFAAGIYSLCETRSTSANRYFSVRGGTYQIVASGVISGVLYRVVVVWEACDAAGDSSGDTSGYGTSYTNFSADTFNGRGGSDGTFTSDALAIPSAEGKQARIKSVSLTPISG